MPQQAFRDTHTYCCSFSLPTTAHNVDRSDHSNDQQAAKHKLRERARERETRTHKIHTQGQSESKQQSASKQRNLCKFHWVPSGTSKTRRVVHQGALRSHRQHPFFLLQLLAPLFLATRCCLPFTTPAFCWCLVAACLRSGPKNPLSLGPSPLLLLRMLAWVGADTLTGAGSPADEPLRVHDTFCRALFVICGWCVAGSHHSHQPQRVAAAETKKTSSKLVCAPALSVPKWARRLLFLGPPLARCAPPQHQQRAGGGQPAASLDTCIELVGLLDGVVAANFPAAWVPQPGR